MRKRVNIISKMYAVVHMIFGYYRLKINPTSLRRPAYLWSKGLGKKWEKSVKLSLLFFMSGLLTAPSIMAQTYPVNATTQVAPPYSVFLSDYVAPGSEQLRLNLLLRDLTDPVYDVRLRLLIEGQGVRIETNPAYNPPPITLEAGLSTWLDAIDLAPYFESQNLIFSGYSRAEFEQFGRLPEGFYQFCFTVQDYRRPEVQVSQQSCQNLWLVRPDPPMLNQPACASELKLNELQQTVVFQWTPMALSPNSSFTTDYIFRLYEIRPEGRNPADIVLTSRPVFETQQAETSLVYGITETPLIPGMEYVWQVQAVDLQGRDRFKNNGYSQVCTFRVAEDAAPLPEPNEFKAWAVSERAGMASWVPSLEPDGYTVEYRLANNPQAEWHIKELPTPPASQLADSLYVVLGNLMSQAAYEVRVGSKRGAFVSTWTETKTFTTLPPQEFACGEAQEIPQPLSTVPLQTAIRGEVFQVGEFEMRLLEVRGGNGTFSGLGAIKVDWLGMTMAVKFTNVRVNEFSQLIDGEVVAISEGIDGLIDRWKEENPEEEGGPDGPSGNEGEEEPFAGTEIDHAGDVDSVYVNGDGEIIVVDENGTETTYEPSVDEETGEKEDTRITDENGDSWTVDKEGNVSKGGPGEGNTPDGTTEIDSVKFIQKELIREILQHYKEEINTHLENTEKGPLEEALLLRILALPDCLPEDEEGLEAVLERITYFEENPEELIAQIAANTEDQDRFEFLIDKLNGEQPPYQEGLTEAEWAELLTMACPHLLPEEEPIVIEGLSRNADLVAINTISGSFNPKDERLEFTYTIKDTLGLENTKLEIYKLNDDKEELVTFYTDLTKGEEIEFIDDQDDDKQGWSGKGSDGEFVEAGEYKVKLTAATDETFGNGYEDYETVTVESNGVDYNLVLRNDEDLIEADDYVLISAEPEMPAISVEAESESASEIEVKLRLKIEYRRDIRQDEDYFPADGWYETNLNEAWEIDFGDRIRGGRATLYTEIGESRDTIIFHIRGTNPTAQAVQNYIAEQGYDDTWFFTRLIRQESNYIHFNNGTNYGPDWTDSQGCPNWGPPHGWGLCQLDLLDGGQRPTAQELWSWQANVDRGYGFLTGEKFNIAENHIEGEMQVITRWNNDNPDDLVEGHADQEEGNNTHSVTYTHASSDSFDFDWGELDDDEESFLDAVWIKSYNGNSNGYYYRLIIDPSNPLAKPEWELSRTNIHEHNYVGAVSGRAE